MWKAAFLVGFVSVLQGCSKSPTPSVTTQSSVAAAISTPESDEDRAKRWSVQIWYKLVEMKPKTKKLPASISELLNKDQPVAGYMIPNDTGAMGEVGEFLLTPIAGGCVHVPAPPPNYVVHVKLAGAKKTKLSWNLVEAVGRLTVATGKDKEMYGYELEANDVHAFDK